MLLYHYTTPAGLEGIIRTKAVWASDCRFLNDSTEFRYGLDIFDQAFASRSSAARNFPTDVIELITRYRQATSDFSVFIASFSEQPDLLSQWRGYNGARGYSLGIHADWLTHNAEAQDFRLFPVLYDAAQQQRVIHEKLTLLRNLIENQNRTESIEDTVKIWWQLLLYTIVALKNEHFREEQEYRLVKTAYGWPQGVRTRATPRGLVPYVSARLDAKIIDNPIFHRNNVGMERVIIGPAFRDHQKLAVDALLASAHMRFTIEASSIPYVAD